MWLYDPKRRKPRMDDLQWVQGSLALVFIVPQRTLDPTSKNLSRNIKRRRIVKHEPTTENNSDPEVLIENDSSEKTGVKVNVARTKRVQTLATTGHKYATPSEQHSFMHAEAHSSYFAPVHSESPALSNCAQVSLEGGAGLKIRIRAEPLPSRLVPQRPDWKGDGADSEVESNGDSDSDGDDHRARSNGGDTSSDVVLYASSDQLREDFRRPKKGIHFSGREHVITDRVTLQHGSFKPRR